MAAWAQSEPPRGSGWVRRRHPSKNAAHAPTRYREVVLTVPKHGVSAVEQGVVLTVSKRGNHG